MDESKAVNGSGLPVGLPVTADMAGCFDVYLLTPKQQAFFARMRRAAADIEAQARGALLMIIDERGLSGGFSLSDDGTRLAPQAQD
jgi:hypothetical protein